MCSRSAPRNRFFCLRSDEDDGRQDTARTSSSSLFLVTWATGYESANVWCTFARNRNNRGKFGDISNSKSSERPRKTALRIKTLDAAAHCRIRNQLRITEIKTKLKISIWALRLPNLEILAGSTLQMCSMWIFCLKLVKMCFSHNLTSIQCTVVMDWKVCLFTCYICLYSNCI